MIKQLAKIMSSVMDNRLTISSHVIYSEKILNSIKLLLLADLHSTSYGEGQRQLIKKIAALKPDVIFIAGDLIDERRNFKCVAELLREIVNIAPVYFATGNHEHRVTNIGYFLKKMQKMGVNILRDETAIVQIAGENLSISGIYDPEIKRQRPNYSQKKAMQRAFAQLDENDSIFKILVAHRPGRFKEYIKYPFDLILSGHEHGGQVRIPFVDVGLYSHGELFPKYTAGIHLFGGSKIVISRGLSRFAYLPRVFNPPELVQVTLKNNAK